MPDTRYSFHHNETTTTTSTTTLRNDLTHSLTYLWISWFLLNWRMTWCGLFVLVGNTSSRYIDGIFQQQIFGWCVVVVLSMDVCCCCCKLFTPSCCPPVTTKNGMNVLFSGYKHFTCFRLVPVVTQVTDFDLFHIASEFRPMWTTSAVVEEDDVCMVYMVPVPVHMLF